MKNIVLKAAFAVGSTALALSLTATPAAAGMSYECWTYKNGSPDKMTTVVADNNSEAVSKAIEKFKGLGISGLPIKCK